MSDVKTQLWDKNLTRRFTHTKISSTPNNVAASLGAVAVAPVAGSVPTEQTIEGIGPPAAAVPKIEISQSNAYEQAVDEEFQGLTETVKSYVIFAIALSTLQTVSQQFGFFYVLVIFTIFFVGTAHIKAYLAVMKQTGIGNANKTLMANVALVNSLILGFVTILLIQIIMARATPFFSDGQFYLESLVLPFSLFALIFGEYYARKARCTPEIDTDS